MWLKYKMSCKMMIKNDITIYFTQKILRNVSVKNALANVTFDLTKLSVSVTKKNIFLFANEL